MRVRLIEMAGRCRRLDLLLTRLHLDHIQGLMFFAPFFDARLGECCSSTTTPHTTTTS